MDKPFIPLPYDVDLDEPLGKTYVKNLLATGDNMAHRFDIALSRGSEPEDLTGATVSGNFIRFADNGTVPITGSVSGNVASVTLSKACYSKPGQYALIVKVLSGDVVNTVFYGEGAIYTSSTDTYVDEENVIPSLEELLAMVDVMEATNQACTEAAENANEAADHADEKADAANTAAANANTVANKLNGMTVSAVSAETAAATITEKNGVKHITFSLPKGENGVDGTSFIVKGMYETLDALQAAHATGVAGDAYAIGTSESNIIYIWDVDASAWVSMGALQGPAGQKGNDGYSPVRGTDYWTEADKTEIVNDVLASLPNASGVSF